MVEINIGIWCASIPSLKALFSQAQRQRTQHTQQGYQWHSSERSGAGGSRHNNNKLGSKGGALGSMGTIIKNEEFVLETVVRHPSASGSRERIVPESRAKEFS